MVLDNRRIPVHFLHTPNKIRTSICAVAQFEAARHYAQCHFKQNMQCYIGGVENTIFSTLDEGAGVKNM